MARLLLTLTALLALCVSCSAPLESEATDSAEELEPEAAEPAEGSDSTPEGFVPEAATAPLPHGLHFVVMAEEHAFVVLDTSAGDEVGSGPVELVSAEDDAEIHTYRVALDEPLGPEPFVLFGHEGELCRVVADDVGVLRRAGFEAGFEWRESADKDPARAWELGESGALLVARLRAVPTACRGAAWASSEQSRAPRVFTPDEHDPLLAARALGSFRQLPDHIAIQEGYSEPAEPPRPGGPWDQYEGATPTTRMFREAASGRRLVLVSAAAGAGCGDFGASLWALFEARRSGLVVRAVGQDETPPRDVLDADGDGGLELFSGLHASFVANGERVHVDASVPFNGCGC
ncbi:MAG: hypothetical protein HS104_26525 [Polyangiaceae bacterium]|nr:hypothetical protein [Polyangiaceae bacterium]MCE7888844.1 hypothetical protein [Sorangiineae bacterium PRO1]MCL4750196.1 hypothetical protein [Myxococcales bacterium]